MRLSCGCVCGCDRDFMCVSEQQGKGNKKLFWWRISNLLMHKIKKEIIIEILAIRRVWGNESELGMI